jgi:hypothetical protein
MHFERARSFPTGEINPLIPRKCPTVTFPAKTTLFAGRQTKPSAPDSAEMPPPSPSRQKPRFLPGAKRSHRR